MIIVFITLICSHIQKQANLKSTVFIFAGKQSLKQTIKNIVQTNRKSDFIFAGDPVKNIYVCL